jgi:AraC family transcriptional regulator, arabinose operon regulatory protein
MTVTWVSNQSDISTASANSRQGSELVTLDLRVRRALELMSKDQRVSFRELASCLNLSVSRFRHLFKKELGMSPRRYVRLLQLRQARRLLENSFLTIKEIAAEVGMNDVSHFGREYKLLYGQTPSQTRISSRHCA